MSTTPDASIEPAAPRSAAARLVDILKPYKELAAIVAAAALGAVTVLEYFATKSEVNIVKCEAQFRVDMTRAELDMLNADRNVERSMTLMKSLNSDSRTIVAETVAREMELYKKQFDTANAAKREAERGLGACRDGGKAR